MVIQDGDQRWTADLPERATLSRVFAGNPKLDL
jgi:hypothetical protein